VSSKPTKTRAQGAPHRSPLTAHHVIAAVLLAAAMSGCGTMSKAPGIERAPAQRGGGYYLDDGPGENPPADIDRIPDAVPRIERLNRGTSRPYTVMGRTYSPMTSLQPYQARGVASWYGRRYNGKKTASGEIYDMYGMSAAHTILPIPSYARVTNPANGKSVIVRINDRGPFVEARLIDLSYTAAHKLGILNGGSAMVEVESIIPGADAAPVAAAPAPVQSPPATGPAREDLAAAQHEPEPAATPVPDARPQPAALAEAPTVPTTRDASGIYLQLGAFGSRENAENYLARLKTQIDWPTQALHVYPKDGLFRVHAGPYASRAEARQAADRISQALGLKPMILSR
jgi:rare lipoprotein A